MLEILFPLFLFAVATVASPGPNNLMLVASAANFGVRATAPHMTGITVGFTAMIVLVGLGLGTLFEQFPVLHEALKYPGGAFILFISYKIAFATGGFREEKRGNPLTFFQAAAFQWVNPKAWVIAITVFSVFSVPAAYSQTVQALAFGAVFGAVTVPSVAAWALFGVAIRRLLASDRALRIFNVTMAMLLVASIALLFI